MTTTIETLSSELPTTEAGFWAMTESCFSTAEHFANDRLQALQYVDLPTLRAAVGPYRFFTMQYTTDLAMLIAKLPPNGLRSQLATFLDEELGHGDETDTHPLMYDRFLVSLGCDPDGLEAMATPTTDRILSTATKRLWHETVPYGIGLRAMGAECLCQVFLTAADHFIRRNNDVKAVANQIDWQFLDIHAGPLDARHREETRQQIAAIVQADPTSIRDLARGYRDAEAQWHEYWRSTLPTVN